jgi:hypothetical protein
MRKLTGNGKYDKPVYRRLVWEPGDVQSAALQHGVP